MALELPTVPLQTAAVTGAILCVITGCLKEKEAYAGIDWVTIFLFAGMLSVATAMEKTGAGKLIADTVVRYDGRKPEPVPPDRCTVPDFQRSDTVHVQHRVRARSCTNRYFHRTVHRMSIRNRY